MTGNNLILVQGLFRSTETKGQPGTASIGATRSKAMEEHGASVGVRHYEWINGSGKMLANRFLRLARGTASPVDAVELMELDEEAVRDALARDSGRACWQEIASCMPYGFDPGRSFILIGNLRELVRGPVVGQRVIWFGRGLDQLSEAEFAAHYTGHHGPLVAENASCLGIRRYRQVASEQTELCDSLRELGLGQASPPPVFAELAMGTPPLNLSSLRARRQATREIKADEKRHIDFARSMLLLA